MPFQASLPGLHSLPGPLLLSRPLMKIIALMMREMTTRTRATGEVLMRNADEARKKITPPALINHLMYFGRDFES